MTYHEGRDLDVDGGRGGNGPPIKLIAFGVVAIAIVIFFLQNGESAPIHFLWMDVEWPIRTVILISLVAGILIDRLGSYFWNRARRRKHERDD